jgi:hypothetical protein
MRPLTSICIFTFYLSPICGSSLKDGFLAIPSVVKSLFVFRSTKTTESNTTESNTTESNIPDWFSISMNLDNTINFYVTHQTQGDYQALHQALSKTLANATGYNEKDSTFYIINDKFIIQCILDNSEKPLREIALFINRDQDLTDEILQTFTEDLIKFVYSFLGLSPDLSQFILAFLNTLDLVLELFSIEQIKLIGAKINSILNNTKPKSTPNESSSVMDSFKSIAKDTPLITLKGFLGQIKRRSQYIQLIADRIIAHYANSKFATLLSAIFDTHITSDNLSTEITNLETKFLAQLIISRISPIFAKA